MEDKALGKTLLCFFVALVHLTGCATAEKPMANFPSFDASYFKQKTKVVEEEKFFSISTIDGGGAQEKGIQGQILRGSFLKAFFAKDGPMREYQIFNVISYKYLKGNNGFSGSENPKEQQWKNFSSVKYQSFDTKESKELLSISREIRCEAFHFVPASECLKFETSAFRVEEKLLRFLAAKYASEPHGFWQYNIMPQSGKTVSMMLSYAEIAGFLEKADDFAKGGGHK